MRALNQLVWSFIRDLEGGAYLFDVSNQFANPKFESYICILIQLYLFIFLKQFRKQFSTIPTLINKYCVNTRNVVNEKIKNQIE